MFCSLNRYLGFPQRVFVTTRFAFDNLVKAYNGKTPVFMSVAKYKSRDEAFLDKFPFDFDSNLGLRIPYKETHKLLDFAEKKEIPHRIIGSGMKGFHFYIGFSEVKVDEDINSKIYSIQYALKKYYNLQAADTPLFGKKSLLIRIPTTKYVAFKRNDGKLKIITNDNYCRYIPDDEFKKGLSHVEKLLKDPGEMPTNPKTSMTIDDIIELIPDYKFKKKLNGDFDLDIVPGGILTPSICSIGLPCLQEIATNKHPNHQERIELASWLKAMGYRDIAICAFIKKLKWTDYSYKDTAANVASVKARFPKCSYLRERYPELCKSCSLRRNKN